MQGMQFMAFRKTSATLASLGMLLASAVVPTASLQAADTAAEPVHLRFTFWGSAFEKKDITAAIDTFNATHPGIKVEGQHIPNSGYVEKITTLLAAGDPPDIAYLDETQAFPWSAEGKLLDLTRQRELRLIARLDRWADWPSNPLPSATAPCANQCAARQIHARPHLYADERRGLAASYME
jgi:ABC-type glycerol-3-phosphate transport system substrate-binding protein